MYSAAMGLEALEILQNLQTAKGQGQGTTLDPEQLRILVEFCQKFGKSSSESGDYHDENFKKAFTRLLGNAAEAMKVKANFTLSAEEVKTFCHYYERCLGSLKFDHAANTWEITLPSCLSTTSLSCSNETTNLGEGNGNRSLVLDPVEALNKLLSELAGRAANGQDMWVKSLLATYLCRFLRLREQKGSIPPLANITDPLHPRLTAMEKLKRAEKSGVSHVQLDSEEVLCIGKLLQQMLAKEEGKMYSGTSEETKQEVPDFASPSTGGQGKQERSRDPLAPKSSNGTTKTPFTTAEARGTSSQTQDTQAKPNESKAAKATLAVDDRMKALAMKYFPEVVLSVLNNKQPVITRWMIHIENGFKTLDENGRKKTQELEDLKSMMLDAEEEYEELLQDSRTEYEEFRKETEQKLAKLESELRCANEDVNKKASVDGGKYEKQLQEEKHLYSKLKKDSEEKTAKLQAELQTANKEIEKAQKASKKREAQFTSKLQSCTNELADWKHKFDAEVGKRNVVQLDYEATLQEISTLKAEHAKLMEREGKCAALENQLAALRSSRTNPQVEKDNIARAVRLAIADKEGEVVKLQSTLAKARKEVQDMQATRKAQTEASNLLEATVKDKDANNALLKDNLAVMEEVLSKTNADLEAARRRSSPDPKIIRELDEARMESKHLKGKLDSMAEIMRALTLQLRD